MSFHTRSLSNGSTFDVVTLPKGTVLFHGFYGTYDKGISEDKLFTELFGDYDECGHYCVAPNTQKFFYPAAFMGDVVYKFQLYAIFVLNYDVNLVSMVLPLKAVHRDTGSLDSATVRCNLLGKSSDECGLGYKRADHCLTPMLLNEHPDIHGYIAITGNDGSWFKTKFHAALHESNANYVDMTTPMVVTNATGMSSIPEIVIHPYHVRSTEKHTIHPRGVLDPIHFALSHISLLNYMPLVYFSETDTFSLLDLRDKKTRYKYLGTLRNDSGKAITPIHVRIKSFLDNALSTHGVLIHNMIFKMSVDLKTGFYIANYLRVDDYPTAVVNKNILKDGSSNIIPFEYPEYMKKRLHGLLAATNRTPVHEDALSLVLAKHKASYKNFYIFDKGKSRLKFKMETAFPYPDKLMFPNKTRKYIPMRHYKQIQTRKVKKHTSI